jgi:hypothetical protein
VRDNTPLEQVVNSPLVHFDRPILLTDALDIWEVLIDRKIEAGTAEWGTRGERTNRESEALKKLRTVLSWARANAHDIPWQSSIAVDSEHVSKVMLMSMERLVAAYLQSMMHVSIGGFRKSDSNIDAGLNWKPTLRASHVLKLLGLIKAGQTTLGTSGAAISESRVRDEFKGWLDLLRLRPTVSAMQIAQNRLAAPAAQLAAWTWMAQKIYFRAVVLVWLALPVAIYDISQTRIAQRDPLVVGDAVKVSKEQANSFDSDLKMLSIKIEGEMQTLMSGPDISPEERTLIESLAQDKR